MKPGVPRHWPTYFVEKMYHFSLKCVADTAGTIGNTIIAIGRNTCITKYTVVIPRSGGVIFLSGYAIIVKDDVQLSN